MRSRDTTTAASTRWPSISWLKRWPFRSPSPEEPSWRRCRGVLAVLGVVLTGCGVLAPFGSGSHGERDGPGDHRLAAYGVSEPIRNLPKSRRGNMAEYSVRGRRYRTLPTAAGYRERGLASWYGRKFHGRETSSGELFDMHAMTAAHRSLPLPTFVRVTRVSTGESIVVKVNDRGPFVDDRLIDLSYGAALHLGVVDDGTAEVVIEALSTHLDADAGELPEQRDLAADSLSIVEAPAASRREPGSADTVWSTTEAADSTNDWIVVDASEPVEMPSTSGATTIDSSLISAQGARRDLIQLGAFSDPANADAMARRAASYVGVSPRVVHDASRDIYRVRIGPLENAEAVDATLTDLADVGIRGYAMSSSATPLPRSRN